MIPKNKLPTSALNTGKQTQNYDLKKSLTANFTSSLQDSVKQIDVLFLHPLLNCRLSDYREISICMKEFKQEAVQNGI